MQNEDKPIPADPKRVTWNKGKLIGAKPPLRPKPCLVDPDQAANRRTNPRLGDVQSRYRQQAARLRCRPHSTGVVGIRRMPAFARCVEGAVGSAGVRRDRGGHYRDLRRAKGPTCPTRARNTSFSIVSSPIRFIAAASSSLTASPSRSRTDPSIPDSARSRQRSSRYSGTPNSRDRLSAASPRSRRRTTSRLRQTLQRWPGASPPVGTACPMESVDGLRPPSLPTGPTKAADDSRRLSFMRAIPSRFSWTMWCPKKPGPAHAKASSNQEASLEFEYYSPFK